MHQWLNGDMQVISFVAKKRLFLLQTPNTTMSILSEFFITVINFVYHIVVIYSYKDLESGITLFPIKTLLSLRVKLEGYVNSKLCPKDVILGWATKKKV